MRRADEVPPEFRRRNPPTAKVKATRASEVATKPVRWLWDKRIPKGKLTMFDGDPDVGKSVVTMDLASRVSTGRTFPDGAPCEAGNVLIVNVEDAKDDTIVPRLKAHGADLDRIVIIDGMPDDKDGTRLLDLPDDVPALKAAVEEHDAALLVIDPVITMLGGDMNKDGDARKALAPLQDMAEETGVTIVAVRHLNKNVSLSAIQRGGGNMGLIGVARAGAFFAHHPEQDGLRVMAPHKSNLAEKQPSLQYVIVGWAIDENIGRVEWKGITEHDANTLAAEALTPYERTAKEEAMEFLRDLLTLGALPSKKVRAEAREADITDATLRRAKDALRIKTKKDSDGPWYWSLPTKDAQTAQHEQVEHLEQVRKIPNRPNPAKNKEGAHVVQDAHVAQLEEGEHLQPDVQPNGHLSADEHKVAHLFLSPPPWLQKQLRDYGEEPERIRKSVCTAVAAKALGDPSRWEEVVPILNGSKG
jgi:KaiC/GvpD/RAD55 family RecA-like ATPase